MATATITTFTVTKNTGNADIVLEYTVNWDTFDQASNVGYHESWKLLGDDTGRTVTMALPVTTPSASRPSSSTRSGPTTNASVARSHAWTIPYADLNEDNALANDDEIRAVVTLARCCRSPPPRRAASESSHRRDENLAWHPYLPSERRLRGPRHHPALPGFHTRVPRQVFRQHLAQVAGVAVGVI